MSKEELDALKKKTVKTCTITIVIGLLASIVPAFIIKGIIDYQAKTDSVVPGAYLAAGIIAAVIIGVIALVCVRTIIGALRSLRTEKKNAE